MSIDLEDRPTNVKHVSMETPVVKNRRELTPRFEDLIDQIPGLKRPEHYKAALLRWAPVLFNGPGANKYLENLNTNLSGESTSVLTNLEQAGKKIKEKVDDLKREKRRVQKSELIDIRNYLWRAAYAKREMENHTAIKPEILEFHDNPTPLLWLYEVLEYGDSDIYPNLEKPVEVQISGAPKVPVTKKF